MQNEEMTLEQVKKLNNSIQILCRQYVTMNRANLIEDVREMMPNVQKFAMWFLGTADIGVSETEKAYMNNEILGMLQDINEALEHNDSVLMYDALECGIAEYLRLFIPEEELQDE